MTLFDTIQEPVRKNAELRDFQKTFKSDIFECLKENRRVLCQMPTGGGKTVVMGDLVNWCNINNMRSLTLAHRDELISQTQEKYLEQFNIRTGRIQSNYKADSSLWHQVGSIASYVGKLGKGQFPADVIIIDEAHHALADGYKKIIKAYPNAMILGFTATPCRLSGAGFTSEFDAIVCAATVLDLEGMGWLCKAKIFPNTIDRSIMERLTVSKGDYNQHEIDDLMMDAARICSIVDTYIERCNGKQAMLYATSIEHSLKIVEAFKFRGIECDHVDGMSKNRDAIFSAFKTKKIQVLCNVGIATEGNDIPGIEVIILARPTKSLSLYLQMCGRGSRPMQGKTEYILLDHANNVYEHGIPNKYHDWNEHFIGKKKGEKKGIKEPVVKQFRFKFDAGGEFTSSLEKLPKDFKGTILEELDMSTYFNDTLLDEFEVLWNLSQLHGYKPYWAFTEIAKYCKLNKIDAPHDGMVGKMAKTVGWGQKWSMQMFEGIKQKYRL